MSCVLTTGNGIRVAPMEGRVRLNGREGTPHMLSCGDGPDALLAVITTYPTVRTYVRPLHGGTWRYVGSTLGTKFRLGVAAYQAMRRLDADS